MPNMGANMNFAQMNASDMIHPNQDPTSIPNPLNGVSAMTSTQAKYIGNKTTDLASEPKGHAGPYTYNMNDKEPLPIKPLFA